MAAGEVQEMRGADGGAPDRGIAGGGGQGGGGGEVEGAEDGAQLAAPRRGEAGPDEGGGGPGRRRGRVGPAVPHCLHPHRSQGRRRLPPLGNRYNRLFREWDAPRYCFALCLIFREVMPRFCPFVVPNI